MNSYEEAKNETFWQHTYPSLLVVLAALAFFFGIPIIAALILGDIHALRVLLICCGVLFSIYLPFPFIEWYSHQKFLRELPEQSKREYEERLRKEEIERKTENPEYLEWCNPQSKEERIVQEMCDAVVHHYRAELNDMFRVKVLVQAPTNEQATGEYHPGFGYFRRPFGQHIRIHPRIVYSGKVNDIEWLLKHELVHAWMDWQNIHEYEVHGPIFESKLREIGG